MAYVEITESCWLWMGSKNRKGYGKFCYKGNTTMPAHRASYEIFVEPIPENLFVCHACDVRNCVNPDHLWLGTHQENMMDMVDKGRAYSKLTGVDVFTIRQLVEKVGVSRKKIMEKYGINDGHLSLIINRLCWKHV